MYNVIIFIIIIMINQVQSNLPLWGVGGNSSMSEALLSEAKSEAQALALACALAQTLGLALELGPDSLLSKHTKLLFTSFTCNRYIHKIDPIIRVSWSSGNF